MLMLGWFFKDCFKVAKQIKHRNADSWAKKREEKIGKAISSVFTISLSAKRKSHRLHHVCISWPYVKLGSLGLLARACSLLISSKGKRSS